MAATPLWHVTGGRGGKDPKLTKKRRKHDRNMMKNVSKLQILIKFFITTVKIALK